MKRWLSFALFLTLALNALACLAGDVSEEMVRLERNRLEGKIRNAEEQRWKAKDAAGREFFNSVIEGTQKKLEFLNRDPEQYFYNESQRRQTVPGRRYGEARDPGSCMGDCASEQGICISHCNGNGQCIGQCAAAHDRFVARCNQ